MTRVRHGGLVHALLQRPDTYGVEILCGHRLWRSMAIKVEYCENSPLASSCYDANDSSDVAEATWALVSCLACLARARTR